MSWVVRVFCLVFLFTAGVFAQPIISNVEVKTSHGSVRVKADITNTPGQSLLQLHYGVTPALGYAGPNAAVNVATPGRYIMESGLAPETTYFFRIKVTATTGTTWWSCSPGSSGPGWSCDDASGMGMFTTAPLPGNHGEPELPTPLDTTMPAVNGSTFTVAEDCSNLQTQINACALADRSLVHEVRIPVGAACAHSYTLPAKTGPGDDTGVCIIRPDVADSALPPEGVQATEEYADSMVTFTKQLYYFFREHFSATASGANGYRLVGLRFRPESPLTTYLKYPITNVVNNGSSLTITVGGVPGTHPWSPNGMVSIYGVQGFTGRGPNGTWRVSAWVSPTKFNVALGTDNQTGTFNFTGSYVSGGQALMRAGNAISDVSNTTPPIVTTTQDHGLVDEPWNTISSASGAVLTLASGHFIDTRNSPVEISGSSVNGYNGTWARTGISGNNLTVTGGSFTGLSCSADCGRVRMKRAIHIQGVEGATYVNGNHLYTVIDDTHLQIDDASAGELYTTGGILSFDPDVYLSDVTLGSNTSRNIIDRCIFKGASEWPNRQISSVNLTASRSAIVDSRIEAMKMWSSVNPASGSWEYSTFGQREAYAVFISRGNVQKIHGTFIECQGICVFAEEESTGVKSDLTLTRNHFYNNPVDMAGGPQSNGLYYRRRQHFELKQGKRVWLDGNTFEGGWVDATPAGAALIFTPRASVAPAAQSYISDITITNNTIKNSCSGIGISGHDETNYPTGFLSSRFKIANNVFHDLDCYKFVSNPSLTGGTIVQGYAVVLFGPMEDITFDHNTVLDGRGRQPAAIQYFYGKHEGLNITNNLLTHNHQNGAGLLGANGNFGNLPAVSGTTKQIWDSTTYNSRFSQNVLIPGVKDTASDINYESTNSNLTFSQPACAAYYSGFTDNTCVGSPGGNDTANERHAAAGFYDSARRNLTLRIDSPVKASLRTDGVDAGADMNALEAAQGKIRNVRLETGINSAALSYIAPDAAACFVDYVTDSGSSGRTRISDGGGSILRTVSLNDLAAGTVYHYRLECGSEQPKGSFVTQQ
jgi:hypothetical protein